MKLLDKTILITGASRGIGLAIAKEFARHKTHLHLTSRSMDSADIKELERLGALSVKFYPADLSQPDENNRLFGRINLTPDVLVNNAGLLTGGLFEEQSIEEFYKMFQVNLLSLVHLTRLFLPKMIERKSGYIVNNASISGKMFFPLANTYAASKAGVVAFTESLEAELEATGVKTLLLITPGIKTKMFDQIGEKYSKNMDVSSFNAIEPEVWAKKVIESVKSNESILEPSDVTKWGLRLARWSPSLFKKMALKNFKR